jgi:hypothetical protein
MAPSHSVPGQGLQRRGICHVLLPELQISESRLSGDPWCNDPKGKTPWAMDEVSKNVGFLHGLAIKHSDFTWFKYHK